MQWIFGFGRLTGNNHLYCLSLIPQIDTHSTSADEIQKASGQRSGNPPLHDAIFSPFAGHAK